MVEREFDNRTSLIVDPADGRIPASTPQAQQRRAAAAARDRAAKGPEDLNNNVRCIAPGVPRIGPGFAGDPLYGYYQILQSRGHVVLLMETFHDARIIPLDGRPQLIFTEDVQVADAAGIYDGVAIVGPESHRLAASLVQLPGDFLAALPEHGSARATFSDLPATCISLNASHVSLQTRSTTK